MGATGISEPLSIVARLGRMTSSSSHRSLEVTWSGRHRPALNRQGIYTRPMQDQLPIWVGVGGPPESFARAGLLGLTLMIAIIGGEPRQFVPLVDLYRRAERKPATRRSICRWGCTCWVRRHHRAGHISREATYCRNVA